MLAYFVPSESRNPHSLDAIRATTSSPLSRRGLEENLRLAAPAVCLAIPQSPPLTRRALLASALAVTACGPRRSRGFSGYAFVANAGARTVSAVDLSSFVLAKQLAVDGAPAALVPSPLRPSVYALMPETGAICEIAAASLSILRKTRLKTSAIAMALSADGKALWVLQPRALLHLDAATLRELTSITLPALAADFDLSGDGRAALALSPGRRLALLRLADGTFEHMVDAGCEPTTVRFQGNGKQILAASRTDRSLTIVDSATGRISVRLPLPIEPANCCFTADGGQMFVTGPGMDAVVIVYPYQTEVGETILAGRQPDGMAVCSSPQYLFVANPSSGSVTVLDIDTRKLVGVVNVGQQPRRIVITPDNRYALVLNEQSGNMGVIRIASFTERRHRTDPVPIFTVVPVGAQPVAAAVVAMV